MKSNTYTFIHNIKFIIKKKKRERENKTATTKEHNIKR